MTAASWLSWMCFQGVMGPPGRYHCTGRHSGPGSPYTAAYGHGAWCRASLVALLGLAGLVWVVFALVALALVEGV